jgi:EmrB/QacA subfamily drug resistance transporter
VAGAFMTQLSTTMVNVSLLSLAAELHASLSTIQWVTSGYLLALAVMLPLTGWLVDRIGAKALYLWSFAAFTLSSTLCGLAWSANALIAFRVLQGMSGGLLAPMVQMMIARAAGKHMARIMGYAVVPILLAPILGPVIAGAILQFASWRWLFLVNLPVGAVAIVLAIFFLPNDREETQRRDLDLVGFALLSPGLVLFLYGSDHMGERIGQITVALSVVLLAMFFKVAIRKGDRALIDLRLFKGKTFFHSTVTTFISNGISFDTLWALYRDSTGAEPGAGHGPFVRFVCAFLAAIRASVSEKYVVELVQNARSRTRTNPSKEGPSPFDD